MKHKHLKYILNLRYALILSDFDLNGIVEAVLADQAEQSDERREYTIKPIEKLTVKGLIEKYTKQQELIIDGQDGGQTSSLAVSKMWIEQFLTELKGVDDDN